MSTVQYPLGGPSTPRAAAETSALLRMASVARDDDQREPVQWFHRPYLPMLRRKNYSSSDLRDDVLAGVVASVVAIPQGLAYALLANLPPVVGLYTSALPPIVYSVLGTSNVCSLGPNALVAMFLPHLVYGWRYASDPNAVAARSSLAAIIVGMVVFCIGMVRLGGLVRFISGPVLTGFTNAAAMVIFISQLPIVLGFPMPMFPYNYMQVSFLIKAIFKGDSNLLSLTVGVATVLFLYTCRYLSKAFPTSAVLRSLNTASCLIVAVIATVVARYLVTNGYVVAILGHVPSGLPALQFPRKGFSDVSELGDVIMSCVPVAFLAFMSLWSVAKKFAVQLGHTDLDPNQEAFALGVTNMVSGFFLCFPCAASFSRTALNAVSGARSPLSNLFVGVVVMVVLQFFTPLLYFLPMPCLGGIILVALLGMIDLDSFFLAWRIAVPDFVVMLASFLFTAIISIEVGLVMGITVSIAVLLQELSEVQTAEMQPTSQPIMDLQGNLISRPEEKVKVIRLTMNLFFGNFEALKETFASVIDHGGKGLRVVVMDAAGVSHADLSGVLGLDEMYNLAKNKGIKFIIIHAHGAFRDRLKASGLFHKLGQQRFQHLPTVEVVRRLLLDIAAEEKGDFKAIDQHFDEEAQLVSGPGGSKKAAGTNGTYKGKYGST